MISQDIGFEPICKTDTIDGKGKNQKLMILIFTSLYY